MDTALDLVLRALCFLAAALIFRSTHSRLREGSFSLYGTSVERAKHPFSFWSVIGLAVLGAIWFLVLGASRVMFSS